MENKTTLGRFNRNSFFAGLIAGIAIVIVLGGVYLLGAKSNSGTGIAKNDDQVAVNDDTAPTVPDNAPGVVKAVTADDHILGSPDAKVFLVEYSDIECPFCKKFHPTTQQIVEDYDGQVALVFRHFPLSFHANAQKEAEATECVADLGGNDKFWTFLDGIFEKTTSNGTGFALTELKPLAEKIGVNGNDFQTCLDSGKFAAKVNQDLAEGQQAGVTGTPGTIIVVNGEAKTIIPGALPVESVKAAIDSVL